MIFVTGNPGKAEEAREILGDVERVDYDYTEIQSESLAEVAEHGAREAYDELGEPCFVDDSGLFIDSLGGFPGPYSSYVYGTLGNAGVLRTVAGTDDRSASFRCVVAYCDGEGVETFEGRVEGRIAESERGENGFGYDPIFEHEGRTFGEMEPDEKNAVSHRRRAFERFAESYER